MNLEMAALADALESWGAPVVTGVAHHGELEAIVTGTQRGGVLVIDEPVVFIRDSALLPS